MPILYRRHPEVRLTGVKGHGVVLHLAAKRYYTMTESGLAIFEALTAPRTVDDLVGVMRDHYDVSAERAAESVQEFLDRCCAAHLLVTEHVG
jgi:hypothetical protein